MRSRRPPFDRSFVATAVLIRPWSTYSWKIGVRWSTPSTKLLTSTFSMRHSSRTDKRPAMNSDTSAPLTACAVSGSSTADTSAAATGLTWGLAQAIEDTRMISSDPVSVHPRFHQGRLVLPVLPRSFARISSGSFGERIRARQDPIYGRYAFGGEPGRVEPPIRCGGFPKTWLAPQPRFGSANRAATGYAALPLLGLAACKLLYDLRPGARSAGL